MFMTLLKNLPAPPTTSCLIRKNVHLCRQKTTPRLLLNREAKTSHLMYLAPHRHKFLSLMRHRRRKTRNQTSSRCKRSLQNGPVSVTSRSRSQSNCMRICRIIYHRQKNSKSKSNRSHFKWISSKSIYRRPKIQ